MICASLFNGLSDIARTRLGEELSSEALFVFINKRRNRIKLLYFDGTGLWVAAKRLERGNFSWPLASQPGQRKIKLAAEALQLVLDGVDLRGAAFKPWYERARPFLKSLFVYSLCVLHTDLSVSGDFIRDRMDSMSLSINSSGLFVRNPAR